jgi:TrfA protein
VIQLPLWHEGKRGIPNAFLRSALFAAIQSEDRVFLEEQVIASQNGITIKFTGKQLNQEDLTVCMTLVHMAKAHPLGTECSFTAYGILKKMGLKADGKQRKILHSSIIRLMACAVEIKGLGYPYAGSLIDESLGDETTKGYHIRLNRKLINIFSENDWTALHWEQRKQLRGKPLALALHGYWSSHNERPLAVTVEFLQEITGRKKIELKDFKRKLKFALNELLKIGFLQVYDENEFKQGKVAVTKPPKALPKPKS